MAVHVPFDLTYELEVKAPIDEVFDVLADVPLSASHFPKVDRLVDLGGNSYRWELQKVGTEQVHIQTVYASTYVADRKAHTVKWTPVAGVGNGQVSGSWTLRRRAHSTHIMLKIQGEIVVPLPALTRLIVVPVVTSENEKLIEKYLANLAKRFGGEV